MQVIHCTAKLALHGATTMELPAAATLAGTNFPVFTARSKVRMEDSAQSSDDDLPAIYGTSGVANSSDQTQAASNPPVAVQQSCSNNFAGSQPRRLSVAHENLCVSNLTLEAAPGTCERPAAEIALRLTLLGHGAGHLQHHVSGCCNAELGTPLRR